MTQQNPFASTRPSMSYSIRLEKESFVFSAAHFLTYAGDVCERLHGHNYGVSVELFGPLDENHYVLDFVATRSLIESVTAELDHRVLLPTEHPLIRVRAEGDEVIATFRERRWVFPADDCRLLKVANTTAELLAAWIAGRLLAGLPTREAGGPTEVVVAVDERQGQVGVCRLQR